MEIFLTWRSTHYASSSSSWACSHEFASFTKLNELYFERLFSNKSALLKIAITSMMLHYQHHTTSSHDFWSPNQGYSYDRICNMKHYYHHPTLLSSFTISWHSYDRIYNIIQHDTLSSSSNIIVITHHFSPFLWQDMQHHTTW